MSWVFALGRCGYAGGGARADRRPTLDRTLILEDYPEANSEFLEAEGIK